MACPFHSGGKCVALTGAVGYTTTVMGCWRRKAVTSGHSPTSTASPRAWSPVVRLGLPIQATGRAWVSAGSDSAAPRGQPAYILGGLRGYGRTEGKRGKNIAAVSDVLD